MTGCDGNVEDGETALLSYVASSEINTLRFGDGGSPTIL